MPRRNFIIDKLGAFAERFEQGFELRFERVARDPRFLAFVGSSLNFASAMRLEGRQLEREVASFRARAHVEIMKLKAPR